MLFHEIRFPTAISRASQGGPERRTDVVTLGSGYEERNSRWADSRRSYDAGYGIKSADDLNAILAFFEERRGRLTGFRWKDHADWKSCLPSHTPSATDQPVAIGDGTTAQFQLTKTYGTTYAPWVRTIAKPVAGTVLVAVGGALQVQGTAFSLDTTTGLVTFLAGHIPPANAAITAGYEFDVPVRFDTDKLDISLSGITYGAIPHIPIVEVRL